MASLYQADEAAYPDTLDAIKLLSQRDLAIQIPINYVPVAGVAVAPACSVNNIYEADVFAKCLSNLLVTGFRRLTLDLYWDETQQSWSFCPVQLGSPVATSTNTSTTAAASISTSSPASLASLSSVTALTRALDERQATTATRGTSAGLSQSSPEAPTSTAATTSQSGSLIRAGPYSCTTGTDFILFLNVLVAHLQNTENNLNATTVFLTLNVNHAATVQEDVLSHKAPSRLPANQQRLSTLLSANATAYLYQPNELSTERSNLNSSDSWFGIREYLAPDAAYFTVVEQNGVDITPNGWPSDGFVQFVQTKRLFAGFGSVSADMSSYNISQDAAIFQPGVIESITPYTISSDNVTSGCFYNASATSVAGTNNSWAVAELEDTNANTAAQDVTSLSACGFTPSLNRTLSNATAADSIDLYHQFVMSTVWSWDVAEPRDNVNSSSDFHCAVINSTSGRWQVDSCNNRHFCACRGPGNPYNWQISSTYLPYDRVDQACGDGTSFTAPRTALENGYLLNQWRQQRTLLSTNDELLYLNFNDLDIAGCWVAGQNSTCPYQETTSTNRLVVVPTVAAVIVGVLTILTIFVKCAANRQNTRRRRRRGNDDMGDYEGVPA